VDPVLELENVTKTFGQTTAVNRLSFRLKPGTVFGFLGPNGSGKTTTIRMILRILEPDEGSVRVFGTRLDEESNRRVGYLPEERGLYKKMKVIDQLVFLGRLKGLPASEGRRRAESWLQRFEAGDWTARKVEELSKGMQQKVQFIGTLLHEPDLIILDEPFAGLDPVASQLLKDVMLNLRRQGRTIIFSTHQMEQVERSCDEILLINQGKAVVSGPISDVRSRYGMPTIKVEFDGDLGDLGSWDGIESLDDQGRYAEIRLKDPSRSEDLLKELIRRVSVRRFEISEASLEDIFISQVRSAKSPTPERVS
jgi:ABC-2 type transport system ATP-binding protein